MATLTIQLGQDTTARLEREARQLGMDVQTYVRMLLGDEDRAEAQVMDSHSHRPGAGQPPTRDDDLSWLDSSEAVVATIRARRRGPFPVQEATADLAALLRSGGVDPGIAPAEWDRRWAEHEARQKELDLADAEKVLREMHELLADEDRGP